jgi:hypothetical protein
MRTRERGKGVSQTMQAFSVESLTVSHALYWRMIEASWGVPGEKGACGDPVKVRAVGGESRCLA